MHVFKKRQKNVRLKERKPLRLGPKVELPASLILGDGWEGVFGKYQTYYPF